MAPTEGRVTKPEPQCRRGIPDVTMKPSKRHAWVIEWVTKWAVEWIQYSLRLALGWTNCTVWASGHDQPQTKECLPKNMLAHETELSILGSGAGSGQIILTGLLGCKMDTNISRPSMCVADVQEMSSLGDVAMLSHVRLETSSSDVDSERHERLLVLFVYRRCRVLETSRCCLTSVLRPRRPT